MFHKTLSITAAALAISGALAFAPGEAEAGSSFTIGGDWGYVQVGGGYGNHGYYGYGGAPYGKSRYYGYDNYYKGGYGRDYGYRAGYGDYDRCRTKWKKKKIRYWNDYNNCWEYKVVRRPYRVCY